MGMKKNEIFLLRRTRDERKIICTWRLGLRRKRDERLEIEEIFFHLYVRRDENVKYIVLILIDMVNRL